MSTMQHKSDNAVALSDCQSAGEGAVKAEPVGDRVKRGVAVR